jgi:hypothetical protein
MQVLLVSVVQCLPTALCFKHRNVHFYDVFLYNESRYNTSKALGSRARYKEVTLRNK